MNIMKASLLAAVAGIATVTLSVTAPSPTQASGSIPVDIWALRDVVNAVQVSPSGTHLLVHINGTREGEYLLKIFKTDDLTNPVRTLNADPMEIIGARWVSDNIILGSAWEIKRETVRRQEDDTRNYATYFYNLEENEFKKVEGNLGLVSLLPDEPNHVLVAANRASSGLGVDPLQAFSPRTYYKLNLKTGSKSTVMRGSYKYGGIRFDNDGNARFAIGQDTDNTVKTYYRKPGDSSWTQFGEVYDQDEHDNLWRFLTGFQGFAGVDANDPNKGYMIEARNGADKASLWEFDFETGEYGKELFAAEEADVMSIGLNSIPGDDNLAFAQYPGEKWERHWFDKDEEALYAALEQQIPYAHQISISSRSTDGRTMVVTNRGPRDPGSFWLIVNGQMAKLGSRNPFVQPEQLADVEYIRYEARDGLTIPAYVTKPNGEGPFPLVVMPHGGPHVSEVVGYDEWGQLLANAGYMVLQPGYRMTVGWGKEHFDGGYGEHGGKMQDDKDDGALYLIEQGMVDPDRVAMFGWSYGGYAALVATSRENNIYQCAIAGAAVADPAKSFRMGSGRAGARSPRALIDWAERRGTIGINPIAEVEKVNIPLLMVHPEDDSRVLYYHFEDYKKAFQAAGKEGEFMTLEDADHFYNTLMYNHQEQFYSKMLSYLANDCGPGGL